MDDIKSLKTGKITKNTNSEIPQQQNSPRHIKLDDKERKLSNCNFESVKKLTFDDKSQELSSRKKKKKETDDDFKNPNIEKKKKKKIKVKKISLSIVSTKQLFLNSRNNSERQKVVNISYTTRIPLIRQSIEPIEVQSQQQASNNLNKIKTLAGAVDSLNHLLNGKLGEEKKKKKKKFRRQTSAPPPNERNISTTSQGSYYILPANTHISQSVHSPEPQISCNNTEDNELNRMAGVVERNSANPPRPNWLSLEDVKSRNDKAFALMNNNNVCKPYIEKEKNIDVGQLSYDHLYSLRIEPIKGSHREIDVIAIHKNPMIVLVSEFLTSEECNGLIKAAENGWTCSLTSIGYASAPQETYKSKTSENRTSKSARLEKASSVLIDTIERRVAALVEVEPEFVECLVVVRYEPGEYFNAHHDGFFRDSTVLIYLNDVENGGETEFTDLGFRVSPRIGTAIYWKNVLPTGEPDYRLKHSGLSPHNSIKYAVNCFINKSSQL